MRQRATLLLLLHGCLLGLGLAACTGESAPADLVLRNGPIYTLDPDRPWAEALAVRAGEIVSVGDDESVAPLVGEHTRLVDLAGGMALPGFHDAHVHPLDAGRALLGCGLAGIGSIAGLRARLADCAAGSSELWVVGLDFDISLFPDGNPQKAALDDMLPDRPVFAWAADGHNAWVNSRALELAGITAETPDPPDGKIERDPVTREPSGTLREAAAELVEQLLPAPTDAENARALEAAVRELNRYGITSFIDASVGEADLRAYQALDRANRLTARVVTSLAWGLWSDHPGAEFDAVLARRDRYASARVQTDSVKIYLDGVLEGETAALLEPYIGRGDFAGELAIQPGPLADAVTRFDALGLQIHLHAVGDRAVRVGLDALEEAARRNGPRDRRPHIAHLQLIDPADIPRFGALDVTATFQPLWAYPDAYITDLNLPVVGRARVDRMYPIGSVVRAGGRIAGGSDWSVSSASPLEAIETGILRQDADGKVPGVLNAAERVGLQTMIAAYTTNGAWLMRHEHEVGMLRPGMRADIAVLDRNLFEIPAERIGDVRVRLTILDGQIIYSAGAP